MLKFYLWLATGHLGFLKIFGHFYKMLWYLFNQSKTNNRKTKKKKKGVGLPGALGKAHSSWPRPSPWPPVSSSPPTPEQAARWRAVSALPPGPPRRPPVLYLAGTRVQEKPRTFPPSPFPS